ncbi:sorting nexin-17 isoform X2 [Chelonia mydas]|uniref:sorting nexin-17 isoform X2 n=1 Tax=Chelonia mydas TaxID=8469 RepID=UPI001CAA24DD|nr:sorting nexin-17 isoform X2 [Chelonia mydas]
MLSPSTSVGESLRTGRSSLSRATAGPKAYNVHVNGVLHCRVRYRQLLGLHEQLRKEYGANVVPAFPPKKIFTLTPAEVEQRREQLEKYMQAVRQDPVLGGSETFNSFLRKAQQETQQIPTEEVPLEVLLSNGQKVTVTILTSDQTEDVLEVGAAGQRRWWGAQVREGPGEREQGLCWGRGRALGRFPACPHPRAGLSLGSLTNIPPPPPRAVSGVSAVWGAQGPCVCPGAQPCSSLAGSRVWWGLRPWAGLGAARSGDSLLAHQAVASKLDLPEDLVGYFSLFLAREAKDGAFSFMRKLQEFELPYVSVTSLRNPEYKIILRKSYWDSSYDDDVMEQRVGLNLLYAQTVSDIERGWILVTKEQHRQLKSLQEKVSKKEFIRLAQTLKYYGYLKFEPCVTDFPEKGCQVIVSAGNSELNFQVRLPSEQIKEGSFKVTRMRCWRVTSSVPTSSGLPGSSPGKAEVKLELAFEYLMSKDRLQWVTITSPQAIMLSICLQSMVDELMVKKSGGSIRKMFRRRANGALRRSDSQQAVKSPPLLDSPDASREPMLKLSSKLTSVSLRGVSHSGSTSDLGTDDFHGNYAFEGIGDEDL